MAIGTNTLSTYLERFANLKCFKKDGHVAPHKAFCLLTVMTLIEKNQIRNNIICPNEDFKRNSLCQQLIDKYLTWGNN